MHIGIAKLENSIRHYDWGSREFIARLQSRTAPSRRPEAELWIGDHPRAPSRILGAIEEPLPDYIRRAPKLVLGDRSVQRFGPTLPFLVKILAAGRPLSIQVHPDAKQALRGFEAEQRRGIAPDAPERSYTDPRRKVELLIALEPISALCGFRRAESAIALLKRVESSTLEAMLNEVRREESDVAAQLFFAARRLSGPDRSQLLEDLVAFARREGDNLIEAHWVNRLTELYPGDPGALAPLLLSLIVLTPGEGLFIQPGTVHSYLEGSGVEVMSSSDNVVRAGLTPKFVNERELRDLATREHAPPQLIRPTVESPGIVHYMLPEEAVDEFSVRVLSPHAAGGKISRPPAHVAKILVCVSGSVHLSTPRDTSGLGRVDLQPGEAAWVPASVGTHAVSITNGNKTATLYEITSCQ